MGKPVLMSVLFLLSACSFQGGSTPLPEDEYSRAISCAISLSSAAKSYGRAGKIREQLPHIAATMNAENACNRLGEAAGKSKDEIAADQEHIFADLKSRSAENPKLLSDFQSQCLDAYRAEGD